MYNKYRIDSDENRIWLDKLRNELLEFGKNFPSPGGGSYYLGDDGTPWKNRPRETWITSRMAHVYSIGAILYRERDFEDKYKKLAAQALSGLMGELRDKDHGGWYAGITDNCNIMETKQCYAHAFVILAATSGLLAGLDDAEKLLEEALCIYDRYFWDDKEGLAVDTWDTEFVKLSDYRGLNANMHTVEAFLAVYDVTGDSKYLERSGRIIDRVCRWSSENDWRIPEHYRSDWTPDLDCQIETPDDPFKPYGATPGHGIEWARLILQWAVAVYEYKGMHENEHENEHANKSGRIYNNSVIAHWDCHKCQEYCDIAEKLYNRAIKDAWNCDGAPGIVYTTDWSGKAVVHDRMHWTLAEAINTSAVLYRKTGNEQYASEYAEFMQYLDEVVHDNKNGSWFHQLDENNKVIGTVWPGKSDIYHALQATLIPYNSRIGVSIAKAAKDGFCVICVNQGE